MIVVNILGGGGEKKKPRALSVMLGWRSEGLDSPAQPPPSEIPLSLLATSAAKSILILHAIKT